jgi:Xaa-Pro aminopeptidase
MQDRTGRPDYEGRIGRVQAAMAGAGVDLLILDFEADFTYLTGIPYRLANPTREAFLSDWLRVVILTPTRGPVVASSRGELYIQGDHFQSEVADRPWIADLQEYDGHCDPSETAKALLSQFGRAARVAVSTGTEALALLAFQSALPEARFTPAAPLLMPLRQVKDEHEIALLRHAARLIENAFSASLERIKPGATMQDITEEIDSEIVRLGGMGNSFPTDLIFAGPGFQGRPTVDFLEPLGPGCIIAYDIGLVYEGYCSDFGRNVIVGEPRPEALKHCQMLREARHAAVNRMRPGVRARDVHEEIRRVFAQYGWDREGEGEALFGHGIGLDIHEPPTIAPWDDSPLGENFVLAIEPRAYRNDIVGGRIEDIVHVTAGEAVALTEYTLDDLIIDW